MTPKSIYICIDDMSINMSINRNIYMSICIRIKIFIGSSMDTRFFYLADNLTGRLLS